MGKLTEAQWSVLLNPPFGFCEGSNMWALVHHVDKDGNHICDGEEIDALLRDGLLGAARLTAPVFVEMGGGDIPDNEMTHSLYLTEAGRLALQGGADHG